MQTLRLRLRIYIFAFREKFARYRELSSTELISIYLASARALLFFPFPFFLAMRVA